jgi:hypothetical protein
MGKSTYFRLSISLSKEAPTEKECHDFLTEMGKKWLIPKLKRFVIAAVQKKKSDLIMLVERRRSADVSIATPKAYSTSSAQPSHAPQTRQPSTPPAPVKEARAQRQASSVDTPPQPEEAPKTEPTKRKRVKIPHELAVIARSYFYPEEFRPGGKKSGVKIREEQEG